MQNVCIQKPHYKQEKNYTCVPASVRMILAFYGIDRNESSYFTTSIALPNSIS